MKEKCIICGNHIPKSRGPKCPTCSTKCSKIYHLVWQKGYGKGFNTGKMLKKKRLKESDKIAEKYY